MENREKPAKVLLNCMPPAHTQMPSASLNILKCVLKKHGFDSEIKYWNIILEKTLCKLSPYFDQELYELVRILPFIYSLTFNYKDKSAINKIKGFIYENYNEKHKEVSQKIEQIEQLPDRLKTRIRNIISKEIIKTDFSEIIITGFSAKFYQWLAALPIAEYTKGKYPDVKTVIGGFDSKGSAFEMLKIFECFDFAIWGEGEYPLLELTDKIKNNKRNFNEISGLVFREGNKIKMSEKKSRYFFDLNNYPEPDYDDFFKVATEDLSSGQYLFYPIETNRGCSWNKCKFCVLGSGYKYRERNPEHIISEIVSAMDKYKCSYFQFLDNNVAGSDQERFDLLLTKLSDLFIGSNEDFCFFTEIIPYNYDSSFYKKLALAGFRLLQIGGESFSDLLISRMNKKNSFSDNLLGYKFCLKYGIQVEGANIITGIPGETEDEIKECIENIPFLRFYTGNQRIHFGESPFALDKLSKFYKEIDKSEIENYCSQYIFNLLPKELAENINRFEFFSFKNVKSDHHLLWKNFFSILKNYYNSTFTYKIFRVDEIILYEEFSNKIKTASIVFDQPEQWEILKIANDEIYSFDKMHEKITSKYSNIKKSELKKMMTELKSKYLLYYNDSFEKIISIIDTELTF